MAKKGLNIYRRKDGRWEGRVRIRRSRDGKAGYRSVYGRSYKEAREKVMALVKRGTGRSQLMPVTFRS